MGKYDVELRDWEAKAKQQKDGQAYWGARQGGLTPGQNKAYLDEHTTALAESNKQIAAIRSKEDLEARKQDPLSLEIAATMARKAPEAKAFVAKAYAPSPEMLAMRTKFLEGRRGEANQAANQLKQEGQEGIARRFAALGASGSGAQLGAMEKNLESAEGVRRKGLADVAGQELQIADVDAARSFQTDQTNQDLQFKHDMSNSDTQFRQELSNIDQANKLKGMDMAERQFEMDKLTTEFNKQMAQADLAAAGKKKQGPSAFSRAATGAIAGSAFGPGGAAIGGGAGLLAGDSFICTELYRQDIISNHLWTLTGTFGQEFKELNPEGFYGYQLFATPLVKLMRKSKIFTKIMKAIFLPWCNWMGHQYDQTIPDSKQGYVVYRIMKWSMPKLYKINQNLKEQLWLTR